jgi:hypothetical protein
MPTYGNIGFSTSNFYSIVVGDSTFETFMDYPYMWAKISKIKLNIVTFVEQVSTKVLQLVPDVPVNSVNQDFQKMILEQNKQILELSKSGTINSNNTNCNNKTTINNNFTVLLLKIVFICFKYFFY